MLVVLSNTDFYFVLPHASLNLPHSSKVLKNLRNFG